MDKFKKFIFISFIISSLPSFCLAKLNNPADSLPCASQIRIICQKWKSSEAWRVEPIGDGELNYSTMTDDFGAWIQIYKVSEDQVNLEKTDANVLLRLRLSKKNCRPDIEVIARQKNRQSLSSFGTDQQLYTAIVKKKNGMILSWSPSMPFSIDAIIQARKVATEEKIDLIVILDRNANLNKARQIVKKNRWPMEYARKFESIELAYRKIENHFPSMLFFKDGRLKDYLLPGLKNSISYRAEYVALQ